MGNPQYPFQHSEKLAFTAIETQNTKKLESLEIDAISIFFNFIRLQKF